MAGFSNPVDLDASLFLEENAESERADHRDPWAHGYVGTWADLMDLVAFRATGRFAESIPN